MFLRFSKVKIFKAFSPMFQKQHMCPHMLLTYVKHGRENKKVMRFVLNVFIKKKLSTWCASSTKATINDLNVDLILSLIKTFAYLTIHSYRTRKRRGRSRYYRARLIYNRVSHFAFCKSLSLFATRSRIISRCTREQHFKFVAREFFENHFAPTRRYSVFVFET